MWQTSSCFYMDMNTLLMQVTFQYKIIPVNKEPKVGKKNEINKMENPR